jgi:hypothetical protein
MGSELQRVLSTAGIRSDMFRLGKAWFGRSISVFCYKFDMCTIHICAFIHTYIYIQYNTPSKPHWCSGWRLAISFQCKFWRVLGYKLQRITQLASIAESGGHQELLCLNSLPQKGIAGTPLTDGVWDDRRLDKIRPDEKNLTPTGAFAIYAPVLRPVQRNPRGVLCQQDQRRRGKWWQGYRARLAVESGCFSFKSSVNES